MKTIIPFIEQAKEQLRAESYNKTMKSLGMSRQQWTAIQKGSGISDENALRIAEVLKIEPLHIIAVSKSLSEKKRTVKNYWLKIAKETESRK